MARYGGLVLTHNEVGEQVVDVPTGAQRLNSPTQPRTLAKEKELFYQHGLLSTQATSERSASLWRICARTAGTLR